MAKPHPIPIPIPSPALFMRESGNRRDAAENKQKALKAIAQCGNVRNAIVSGKIDRITLARYLNDGVFSEQLRLIEHALAARMTARLSNLADSDDDQTAQRAIEFALPALDPRFDSGIRRQQAANQGSLASILLQHALKDDETTVELRDPLAE